MIPQESTDLIHQADILGRGNTGQRRKEQEGEGVRSNDNENKPTRAASLPLETVERALEDALELLLVGDEPSIASEEEDSVTTAHRIAAEESLRDELARADEDSGFFHYGPEEGWWLEIKQNSMTETTIATETSSWFSHHKNTQHKASPRSHWERLLNESYVKFEQRLGVSLANNLLAVAWERKVGHQNAGILWMTWKTLLDNRLQKEALVKLCSSDSFHLAFLAVPTMGSRVDMGWHGSIALFADTWRLYTRNKSLCDLDEIE